MQAPSPPKRGDECLVVGQIDATHPMCETILISLLWAFSDFVTLPASISGRLRQAG